MIRSGMMKFGALALGALLTGCVSDQMATARALNSRSMAAAQACDEVPDHWVDGHNAVAWAECHNRADAMIDPITPGWQADIWYQLRAERLALAEKYRDGKIDDADFTAAIARIDSNASAEVQRRSLAQRSVAAQESIASAVTRTVNCRTWSDGAGVATQVYTSCQ